MFDCSLTDGTTESNMLPWYLAARLKMYSICHYPFRTSESERIFETATPLHLRWSAWKKQERSRQRDGSERFNTPFWPESHLEAENGITDFMAYLPRIGYKPWKLFP